jgi:hypothetical protein
MNPERSAVTLVVATVLLVSVASGPLVPGVGTVRAGEFPTDLHSSFGDEMDGVGVEYRLSYDSVSLPERGHLQPTAERDYAVTVAPAAIDVRTGPSPVLVSYRLQIPALEHSHRVERTIDANRSARVELALPARTLSGERVTEQAYDGVLTITLTQGDRTFEAASTQIVLEVDG